MTEKEKLIEKVRQDILARKGFKQVLGAFGDAENCEGYVEEILLPPKVKSGRFSKWYGCTYLFKGTPDENIVEGIGFGKAFLSILPRESLEKSNIVKVALFLLYVFSKKAFYHIGKTYFSVVAYQLVRKINLPENEYSTISQEIKRAVKKVLLEDYKKLWHLPKDSIVDGSTWEFQDPNLFDRNSFISIVWYAVKFICLFLDYDNAYRFPLQDASEILNKENIRKNVIKEVDRVFKVVIVRAVHIKSKMTSLRRIVLLALLVSPWLRKFVKSVVEEIDLKKINLDRDDWYFCLNRTGYNYRGMSYEKRLEIRKKIDKAKGHYRLVLLEVNSPGQEMKRAFQVLPFFEKINREKETMTVS